MNVDEVLKELAVLQYKDKDTLNLILDYADQVRYVSRIAHNLCVDLQFFFGFSALGKHKTIRWETHRYIIEYETDEELKTYSSRLECQFSGPEAMWKYADDFRIDDGERFTSGAGFLSRYTHPCAAPGRLIAGEVGWCLTTTGQYKVAWYTTQIPRRHLCEYSAAWGLAIREEEGEVLLEHGIRTDCINIARQLNCTLDALARVQRRLSRTLIEAPEE